MAAGIERRAMSDLWFGHLAADLASGALPAVLVFLRPELHLSYAKAGAVVLVATATSSVAQPIFGRWSDKHVTTWLLPLGIVAAAIGISLAPLAGTYAVLLVLVSFSGLGVGVFHPEAMKLARHVSGERRASGMAVFQTGGNLGIAFGPLIAGIALAAVGSKGGLVFLIPGAIATVLLLRDYGLLSRARQAGHAAIRHLAGEDRPGAFKLLLVAVGLRSVAYYGLFTFVPLYEVSRGHSKAYATALLSCVLFGGAIGTICAGPLADRYGHKLVLVGSLALSTPLVLAFVLSTGAVSAIAVTLAGVVIVSTFSLTTVMSQEYLPSRLALAAGTSVGLAMGLGGIAAVLLGIVADSIDLHFALLIVAVAPALGAVAALYLPGGREVPSRPAHAATESVVSS
jgi:MFS transporter, FSR family, fosmidomycin resistance protein